ncbi:L-histidine N(alpha)-methyltransferase [Emcibacter sp. SYSU 3D8]|uniref:L-histidine N(alpha)-methyltransferase n=1 Tax=Emcibacter sp. SYSU 3D8 TaxID=3133969 RepID=UPI0031FE8C7D
MDKPAVASGVSDQAQPSSSGAVPAFLLDRHPPKDNFAADVLEGLAKPQKQIPPKYFYDARGSDLFERICQTPEYYVTRTELKLLSDIGPDVAGIAGRDVTVIEFGSGSDAKIRRLLDALPSPGAYVAIDISRAALEPAIEDLARDYADMSVGGIVADFSAPVAVPHDALSGGRKLAFFPGSTIGNMERSRARQFLADVRAMLAPEDGFLVGVDLRKGRDILDPAYNDDAGVTAEFNLNVLRRINRELGGSIDLGNFRHLAFYNETEGRIEMHLRSTTDQQFEVAGRQFAMERDETIHTENSYKYSVAEFALAAESAGFRVMRTWQDPRSLFSIHYLAAA